MLRLIYNFLSQLFNQTSEYYEWVEYHEHELTLQSLIAGKRRNRFMPLFGRHEYSDAVLRGLNSGERAYLMDEWLHDESPNKCPIPPLAETIWR